MLDTPGHQAARIQEIIAAHQALEGAALPILHALQGEFGYVPEEALAPLAQALNISRAEIHGVVSFYHDFRRAPAPAHVVKICRAEACQAVGGRAFEAEVSAKLAGRADVAVEAIYCLGLCACGPAAMVDGELMGRASAARICDKLGVA